MGFAACVIAFVVISIVSNVITEVIVLWYYVAFAAAAYAVTRYRENAALRRSAAAGRGARAGSGGRLAGRAASRACREPRRQHQVRILHVNKFLYRRGGAEAYMEDLADLQVAAGHTVAFFGMAHPLNTHLEYATHFPSHIELEPPPPTMSGRVRGVARMLYSTSASRGMDAVLADFRPDVVHLHNIYHQLSPSVLRPVARRKIPAVMTLHDYKLACPTYQFLDHGNLCQACLGGHFQHAVLRRCKDGSLGASAVMAGELFVHTHHPRVRAGARLHLPEPLSRGQDARSGRVPAAHAPRPALHRHQGHPGQDSTRWRRARGRPLSPEKGIDVAIRAVGDIDGAVLDIAGTGPDEAALRRLADTVAPGRVRFHGLVDKAEVQRLMLAAAVVVVPSRWYENQPMVVLEALARGVPVVGSALGGMPELIEPGATGDLVPRERSAGARRRAASLRARPRSRLCDARPARATIVAEFSPERHLERISAMYAGGESAVRPRAA